MAKKEQKNHAAVAENWETVPVIKRVKKESSQSPASSPRSAGSTPLNTRGSVKAHPQSSTGYFGLLDHESGGRPASGQVDADAAPLSDSKSLIGSPSRSPLSKKSSPASSRGAQTPQQVAAKDSVKKASAKPQPPNIAEQYAGLDALNKLDVPRIAELIATVKRLPIEERAVALAEAIDVLAGVEYKIRVPTFSKKFTLKDTKNRGPLTYVDPAVTVCITQELNQLGLPESLPHVIRGLVENEKRCLITGSLYTAHTIGHLLLIQLVAKKMPDAFFKPIKPTKPAIAEEVFARYRAILGLNPAAGHTLLWVCEQQRPFGAKAGTHPLGLTYWMQYFLPLFGGHEVETVEPTLSSSIATSIQVEALEYLQEIVLTLRNIKKQGIAADQTDSLPSVNIADIRQLARASLAPASKRKRSDEIAANLARSYSILKELVFDLDADKAVFLADEEDEAFAQILEEIQLETSPNMREELLDMSIALIAEDARWNPLARSKTGSDQPLSPLLQRWSTHFEERLSASRLIIDRLLREGTKRKSRTMWQRIIASRLRLALTEIKGECTKNLKKLEKRKERQILKATPLAVIHKQELKQTCRAIDKLIKILPKRRQSKLRPFLKSAVWLTLLYFVYYTVVHVMCAPGSETSCPLNAPMMERLREDVWHARLEPAYNTSRRLTTHYAEPYLPHMQQAASAVTSFVRPAVHAASEKWNRVEGSKEFQLLVELQKSYTVHWFHRIKQEWHDMAVITAEKVIPAVADFVSHYLGPHVAQLERAIKLCIFQSLQRITDVVNEIKVTGVQDWVSRKAEVLADETAGIINEEWTRILSIWRSGPTYEDVIWLVRGFYLSFTTAVILGTCIPFLDSAFLQYGKTLVVEGDAARSISWFTKLLREALSVPKHWFAHFYLLGLPWAAYIFYECTSVLMLGTFQPLGKALAHLPRKQGTGTLQLPVEVLLAQGMMLVQVARRLYESLAVTKPSHAKMNVLQYLLGLSYYAFTVVAVGIDGYAGLTIARQGHSSTVAWDILRNSLRPRHAAALSLAAFASISQNQVHHKLARLRSGTVRSGKASYVLPRGGWFRLVACPHYFFEILFYTSICLLTGFQSWSANMVLMWVIVDLSVSAGQQIKWYKANFKDVPGRWKRVIPFIY
ncbi:hypothetical protein BC832DRAFT_539697 [Gaertneriomyces semiglobifer]|nr:hypothetical protein BC832DRAFT_539697 [Gaertneriomyces semiglobifer]